MMKGKRIIAILLLIFTTMSIVAVEAPEKAEAEWSDGYGKIYVYNLENDFKDGKFRFREKIVYDTKWYNTITVKNIYLTNSAGKKVGTWKEKKVLTEGGTTTQNYSFDFSSMPSDTYTFHFTVYSNINGKYKNYTRSVTHSAGKVTYTKSTYFVDTYGDKNIKVYFNIKALKGYKSKFEVFNAEGARVYMKTFGATTSADATYGYTWDFCTEEGWKQDSGKYTFKVTVNGKSASKTLDVTIK